MFHVYEPDDHCLCSNLINPFLNDLPEGFLLSPSDLQQATFILLPEEFKPIQGGAFLLKKKIGSLHAILRKKLQPHFPLMQDVWAGTICLRLPNDIGARDFESICKIFYPMIYEDLVAFGIKEKASFIYVTLTPVEHLSTEVMGFWPYVLAMRADESSDGLFHGVLALKGSLLKTQWFWKDPELLSQQMRMGRGTCSNESAQMNWFEKKEGISHG